jgi:hypothetical protein
MDWRQRLKSIVEDDTLRGKIKLKWLWETPEFWTALFEDTDDAVQASLLALIEPAIVGMFSNFDLFKKARSFSFGHSFLIFIRLCSESFRISDVQYNISNST